MERSILEIHGTFVIVVIAHLSSIALAEEVGGADLERGRMAYLEADFEGASEAFEAALQREGISEPATIEAHRYLAALELVFEHHAEARRHVEAVVRLDRTVSPPEGAPSELGELFDQVRSEIPEEQPEPEVEPEPEEPGFTSRWVTLGVGVGLYVPSIINDMLPHVSTGLDVGVLLPFYDRRLSVAFSAAYSPPGNSDEGSDPRIGQDGGDWSFEARTHEIFLSFGLIYRFLPPGVGTIWPYFGAMARVYMLKSAVNGEAEGAEFGENTEMSTQWGGVFLLGAEVRAGPGGFYFDMSFSLSDLPHKITGDTSTGALAVNIGYRFFI